MGEWIASSFAAWWLQLGRTSGRRVFGIRFQVDDSLPGLFYTLVQVDSGQAREAIQRLRERLKQHPGEPESLAGLVQAYRFCGLLEESIDAHRQATALDPTVVTGVAHTFFLNGDFPAAIEAYAGHGAYYLDAAAWAALGNRKRAVALLGRRLADRSLSNPVVSLMTSLLALLENRIEDAIKIMDENDRSRDPEIFLYFARHYSEVGRCDSAIQILRRAASLGFICAPKTLRRDPWFRRLLNRPGCHELIKQLEASIQEIRSSLRKESKRGEGVAGCMDPNPQRNSSN